MSSKKTLREELDSTLERRLNSIESQNNEIENRDRQSLQNVHSTQNQNQTQSLVSGLNYLESRLSQTEHQSPGSSHISPAGSQRISTVEPELLDRIERENGGNHRSPKKRPSLKTPLIRIDEKGEDSLTSSVKAIIGGSIEKQIGRLSEVVQSRLSEGVQSRLSGRVSVNLPASSGLKRVSSGTLPRNPFPGNLVQQSEGGATSSLPNSDFQTASEAEATVEPREATVEPIISKESTKVVEVATVEGINCRDVTSTQEDVIGNTTGDQRITPPRIVIHPPAGSPSEIRKSAVLNLISEKPNSASEKRPSIAGRQSHPVSASATCNRLSHPGSTDRRSIDRISNPPLKSITPYLPSPPSNFDLNRQNLTRFATPFSDVDPASVKPALKGLDSSNKKIELNSKPISIGDLLPPARDLFPRQSPIVGEQATYFVRQSPSGQQTTTQFPPSSQDQAEGSKSFVTPPESGTTQHRAQSSHSYDPTPPVKPTSVSPRLEAGLLPGANLNPFGAAGLTLNPGPVGVSLGFSSNTIFTPNTDHRNATLVADIESAEKKRVSSNPPKRWNPHYSKRSNIPSSGRSGQNKLTVPGSNIVSNAPSSNVVYLPCPPSVAPSRSPLVADPLKTIFQEFANSPINLREAIIRETLDQYNNQFGLQQARVDKYFDRSSKDVASVGNSDTKLCLPDSEQSLLEVEPAFSYEQNPTQESGSTLNSRQPGSTLTAGGVYPVPLSTLSANPPTVPDLAVYKSGGKHFASKSEGKHLLSGIPALSPPAEVPEIGVIVPVVSPDSSKEAKLLDENDRTIDLDRLDALQAQDLETKYPAEFGHRQIPADFHFGNQESEFGNQSYQEIPNHQLSFRNQYLTEEYLDEPFGTEAVRIAAEKAYYAEKLSHYKGRPSSSGNIFAVKQDPLPVGHPSTTRQTRNSYWSNNNNNNTRQLTRNSHLRNHPFYRDKLVLADDPQLATADPQATAFRTEFNFETQFLFAPEKAFPSIFGEKFEETGFGNRGGPTLPTITKETLDKLARNQKGDVDLTFSLSENENWEANKPDIPDILYNPNSPNRSSHNWNNMSRGTSKDLEKQARKTAPIDPRALDPDFKHHNSVAPELSVGQRVQCKDELDFNGDSAWGFGVIVSFSLKTGKPQVLPDGWKHACEFKYVIPSLSVVKQNPTAEDIINAPHQNKSNYGLQAVTRDEIIDVGYKPTGDVPRWKAAAPARVDCVVPKLESVGYAKVLGQKESQGASASTRWESPSTQRQTSGMTATSMSRERPKVAFAHAQGEILDAVKRNQCDICDAVDEGGRKEVANKVFATLADLRAEDTPLDPIYQEMKKLPAEELAIEEFFGVPKFDTDINIQSEFLTLFGGMFGRSPSKMSASSISTEATAGRGESFGEFDDKSLSRSQ